MSVLQEAPVAAHHARASRAPRDSGIDLVRALCVVGVVVLHAMMVGISIVDGAPVFDDASRGTWWIVPLSWALQIMPMFFVIGGFSGFLAYRNARERGGSARAFVAARVHRLLRPAVVVIAVIGGALLLLSAAGVPDAIVTVAGFRYGQPLWFLAVFLLCQALLPALVAAHRRHPLATLLLFVAAALVVDVTRSISGVEALGFLNLGFVWLALQQLGFFLAEGRIDALSRRTRTIAGLLAVALLLLTFTTGTYSPDLIANINPPTAALLLVGVAHTAVLSLHRDRLARASNRRILRAFSAFVNRRTMTIYLWHMPVLLTMAGVTALMALSSGDLPPAVDGAQWWLGRPLWLATTLALTALIAKAFASIEVRPHPALTTSRIRVFCGVLAGLLGIVLLLAAGTTPATALIAVSLSALALRLASSPARYGSVSPALPLQRGRA